LDDRGIVVQISTAAKGSASYTSKKEGFINGGKPARGQAIYADPPSAKLKKQ